MAKVFQERAGDIREVARLLKAGAVVAIPTETVYGLAANALDEAACRRIFEIKGRPLIDPLIVHLASLQKARELAEMDAAAEALAAAFWPGPLTLVRPKKPPLPEIVTAGRGTVALRMPNHPLARRVLKESGLPLAAPSANPFGYLSATRSEHILESFGKAVEYILEGGPSPIGIESSIVDLTIPGKPVLLRPGAISKEALEKVLKKPLGEPLREFHEEGEKGLPGPGLLPKHYSPKTPLSLLPPNLSLRPERKGNTALVQYRRKAVKTLPQNLSLFWLTEDGDPAEAARELFHLLRRLDKAGFDRIYVEKAPGKGLGKAINDRLQRAAGA